MSVWREYRRRSSVAATPPDDVSDGGDVGRTPEAASPRRFGPAPCPPATPTAAEGSGPAGIQGVGAGLQHSAEFSSGTGGSSVLRAAEHSRALKEAMDKRKRVVDSAGRAISLFRKMARLDISAMVIGVTGLALAIADAEIEYETQAAAPVSVPLRVLQSASTAALLALICARTSIALLLGRETGDFPVRASLRTSGLVWQLAAELVLCSVHIPPGLPARTFTFHTLDLFHEYSFASLITVPMLLRLYLVARVYLNHAPYTSQRARRVGRMGFAEVNYSFALKATLQQRPAFALTAVFAGTLLVCSYWIRVFERPFSGLPEGGGNFEYVWNSLWLIVVTMSSVGFGDVVPVTHAGRLTVSIAAGVGVALVGLTVVSLQNALQLSLGEERAFQVLRALALRGRLQKDAARVIQSLFRYAMATTPSRRRRVQHRLRVAVAQFANARRAERTYVRQRADLQQSYMHAFKEATLTGVKKTDDAVQVVRGQVRAVERRLARIERVLDRLVAAVEGQGHALRPAAAPAP